MLLKPSIAFALQISRQIFDCNAGIYTHILRLMCAKTTFHRLTLLCGIADVTNAANAYSPSEIVAQYNTFFTIGYIGEVC